MMPTQSRTTFDKSGHGGLANNKYLLTMPFKSLPMRIKAMEMYANQMHANDLFRELNLVSFLPCLFYFNSLFEAFLSHHHLLRRFPLTNPTNHSDLRQLADTAFLAFSQSFPEPLRD